MKNYPNNNEYLAPIVLFVYNRPWHTQQTVEALLKNELSKESELFIYSDAPKNKKTYDGVKKVRKYIKRIREFKKTTIIERENNWGLANSIIDGVTTIVNKYGRIIVLEDDLITSPFFLQYMNDALNMYEKEESVASIHAYVYPIKDLPETFFLKGADCWGWATWDRAWKNFEPSGTKILNQIKQRKLEKEIDFNNSTNYIKMLRGQIKGKIDSWAIRWHLSAFLKDKLTLYPGESFVKNIGCDYSGQHSMATTIFDPIMFEKYIGLKKIQIVDNADAYKKYELYYNENKNSLFIKGFRHFLNFSRKHLLKTK